MRRREKTGLEEGKVAFEAFKGRCGGEGLFGLEEKADESARQAKLRSLAEQRALYGRGYEGGQRRWPRCGQGQRYKGEARRELIFACGTVTVHRAYYVCAACGQTTSPLDERWGLAEGQEPGRVREKLALVAVLVPYPQAPQAGQTLLGSERHASGWRRVALREAQRLTTSPHRQTLPRREQERIYLQVDGQLCPPREPRLSAEDQGDREAKAGIAFSQHDVAEVSKERHELLHKVLQAKITDSEEFRGIFAQVYPQAPGEQGAAVSVLADGARWIWLRVEDLLPHAIQLLDFSHVKPYLWEAGKLIYGEGSAFVAPWVKEQETCLVEDKGEQVIAHLQYFLEIRPDLASVLGYFQHNAARMYYGTYRPREYFIGSGAIESAGKQIAAARIKGPGRRWNVTDLNALLVLRCVFLERSGQTYWTAPARLAA
jgi:hypothetical protein